ncbi:MAG: GTP-binding protein [Candidatus Lokiarchaeota archaeon]|nr:GTP-binding protein [Candidatus Lokiarchaeota archaeon]
MIHNVLLVKKTDGEVVTRTRFWRIDFTESDIQDFIIGYRDVLNTEGLAPDTPVFVGTHKIFHGDVDDDMILMFVTDGRDEDRTIKTKVRKGAKEISTARRGNSIGYIRDNLEDILGDLIFTRFKVSFVGSGGVGKSTLLRLLFGKEPAPGGYTPTINVAVDSSETVQFGTFLITLWDFAGQAVFQDLWEFYFSGTDVIFLICDSSFRNVMQTKTLLRNIRKEAPGVPLYIIANKQDLPESMRADKIQRLLGASTFPMIAVDKERRLQFIRFMLEVTTKTVGVELPDRPVSEMITVRRETEPEHEPPGPDKKKDQKDPKTTTDKTSDEKEEDIPDVPTKILQLLFIVQNQNMYEISIHLNYTQEEVDPSSITSLINALDMFKGMGDEGLDPSKQTDALKTIEHDGKAGNHTWVEKTDHFILAAIVDSKRDEDEIRVIMRALLSEAESRFEQELNTRNESEPLDISMFEPLVFEILTHYPLRKLGLNYLVRTREVGKPLPFDNREVGHAVVAVKSAIDGTTTVGGLVRSLDLPREKVMGALQIMEKYGWIDFKVDIGPDSVLLKIAEPDPEIGDIYGPVMLELINRCDGKTALKDIVKQLKISLPPVIFVVTKLVLDGVLEVVA